MQPEFESDRFEGRAVSPFREMGAYESLWSQPGTTSKSLAARFALRPRSVPSDFVPRGEAEDCAACVQQRFAAAGVRRFGVPVRGAREFPRPLRDAAHPVALLY